MTTAVPKNTKIISMVYISIFSILIAICSWISIPFAIPFTLQTFAIFITVGILGGKLGTASIIIYVLLGLAGIPVFSGFTSGINVVLGYTGGYIIGFIFSALVMWGIEKLLGRKSWALFLSMLLGLITCYAFGTAWFMLFYLKNSGPIGLFTVLGWCVFPFIIPDLIKISLALVLSRRLAKYTLIGRQG